MDVMYLDFAKAFDKVAHQRLLVKLRNQGLMGSVRVDYMVVNWQTANGWYKRTVFNLEGGDFRSAARVCTRTCAVSGLH